MSSNTQSSTGQRPTTTSRNDLRTELLKSLLSLNPLRQSIDFNDESLFLLEYIRDYGLNSSLVHNYNIVMEHIRDFVEKITKDKISINPHNVRTNQARIVASGMRKTDNVVIMTKVSVDGVVSYYTEAEKDKIPYPYNFIKKKGMNIQLVIVEIIDGKVNEVLAVPFMVGSKWCRTSLDNHNPILKHQHGENILDMRGYFLVENALGGCAPKYFFAHEKIAHNNIATVQNDQGLFITTLKTLDERNNSVETRLYKEQGKSGEEIFYLETTCLKVKLRVNDLFRDIHTILNNVASETSRDIRNDASNGTISAISLDNFIEKIMLVVAGDKLIDYIIYDHSSCNESPFVINNGEKLELKTSALFKETNDRKRYYTENFESYYRDSTFKEFMINAIFPSISARNSKSSLLKHDAYIGKAILLMRMLVSNILTSRLILEQTDRNNVGNKVYMIGAELIRRDLTRDNGALIRMFSELDKRTPYNPKASARSGDTNIIEAFDMNNFFNAISLLTSLNTPRSAYSKRIEPREVNASHTGVICPSESPSTEKIGLVTHMACTAAISSYKDNSVVEAIVNNVLAKNRTKPREFGNIFGITSEIVIRGKVYKPTEAKKNIRLISINSIPYALITHEQFLEVRQAIKTNLATMDVAVILESIKVNSTKEIIILSYNILCDSGRIYRPLYRTDRLTELGLTGDKMEQVHKEHHNFTYFIEQGIIELVFPSEMGLSKICETRKQLHESPNKEKYEYCEIDPYAIFGMVSSCAPMFNHNPGNRALHLSAMDKALLSKISSNENMLGESSAKKLHTTEPCATTTKSNEYFSRHLKNGMNVVMGFSISTHNQEDAIIILDSFARSIVSERIIFQEFTINDNEQPGIPQDEKALYTFIRDPRYHAINPETGMPRLKSVLKEGDFIFSKYTVIETKDPDTGNIKKEYKMRNAHVQTGKEGYVQKVSTTRMRGETVYQIVLATIKTLEYGDKVSSRYSQKSVVGGIIPDNLMSYVDDPGTPLHGTTLGALFSSMSITSRGTAGLLLEPMLGNIAVSTGKVQDATSFTVNPKRMIGVNEELMKLGHKPWCVYRIFNPMTGTHMHCMVGVVHIRVLKHTAVDKQKSCGMLNYRADLMTRQPTKGGPTGGSRLGYMDSNTLFGLNASGLVNQLFNEQSSKVVVNVCTSCHHLNDRCNRDPTSAKDTKAIDHCTRCGDTTLREVTTTYSLVMIHNYLLSVGAKLDLFTQ